MDNSRCSSSTKLIAKYCVFSALRHKSTTCYVETEFILIVTVERAECGLITPAKQKVKDFLQRIRDWLRANPSHKPEVVIGHLNPILRGWANYYRHVNSAKVFSSLDHYLWKAIFQWCRKRHPRKGKRWVVDQYFKVFRGQKWYFTASAVSRDGQAINYSLTHLATIPIERHIKIAGKELPDDPTLRTYWQQRQTRQGKTY